MGYTLQDIDDSYKLNNPVNEDYRLYYGVIDHETDPLTGQTWLFEGGYFRRDGLFIRNATFNRN